MCVFDCCSQQLVGLWYAICVATHQGTHHACASACLVIGAAQLILLFLLLAVTCSPCLGEKHSACRGFGFSVFSWQLGGFSHSSHICNCRWCQLACGSPPSLYTFAVWLCVNQAFAAACERLFLLRECVDPSVCVRFWGSYRPASTAVMLPAVSLFLHERKHCFCSIHSGTLWRCPRPFSACLVSAAVWVGGTVDSLSGWT